MRARAVLLALLLAAACGGRAAAQLGELVSPGPLSRPHAALGGLKNCEKCHERGKQVPVARCLSCHEPVARRIAAKIGVHRAVTDTCTSCHAEHAGVDAPLRPFDVAKFDHKKETGFALDGLHAPLAAKCATCHKARSFLTVSPACASCHADIHKGKLGADCASCHSAAVRFKETRAGFDHSRAAFKLDGAHLSVACEKCHVNQVFRGLKFDTCTACHKSPHQQSLGASCTSCHTAQSWKTTKIDHARTGFPLAGKHAQVPCASCHVKPPSVVRVKASTCATCHADPHKGTFKQDCASCHKETGFKGAAPFDHVAKTRFTLVGKHAQVPCASCHKSAAPSAARPALKVVDFRGLKTECLSCHADPHRGQFGAACQACHAAEAPSFTPARFSHDQSAFQLTGKHQAVACAKCHRSEAGAFPSGPGTAVRFKGIATECRTCHADVHLGQFKARCETCHTTATFAVTSFKHKTASAFFAGAHAKLACVACHKKTDAVFPAGRGAVIRFSEMAPACASCHKDAHQGALGARCESCHSVDRSWKNASRAFHKASFFPLEGKHLEVPCASCHVKGEIKGTPRRCYDCHWIRRQDDRFRTRLGNECESCHRPTSWKAVAWDHGATTGFALSGAHRQLDCETCHKGQVFRAAKTETCFSCHRTAFEKSSNPNHIAAGFPTQCETCHRPSDATWHQGRFDHTAVFPLVGLHGQQPCATCHKNSVYRGTSRDCAVCHLTDFQKSVNPNHIAAGFPTQCETCHRPSDATWHQGRFDHTAVFPLVGLHGQQPCATCHKNSVYRGTSRDCAVCHLTDFQKSVNPNHIAAGFPTQCETCHRPSDATWHQGKFNHTAVFPLVGLHGQQPCAACHVNNVFPTTPSTCAGCHLPLYQKASNPNHASAGFPSTCDTCHKATDPTWLQGTFNHASVYPLVGLHATQPCAACHVNNVFPGTQTACTGCHLPLYQKTTNPNHATAGFGTTCDTCHKPTDPTWLQGSFNHASVFPLVGLHATQPCAACHINNVFRGTQTTCAGCHLPLYQKTSNPNHATAGFPTACDTCHKPTDPTWLQGTFNHASVYPLVGLHATQPCAACHINNVFPGTQTTCAGCHLPLYQKTTNPNHTAAGFPTTCDTCHKPTDPTWLQGVFAHTRFPITSGRHAGNPCSACHNNPSNFQVFTCLTCHSASQTTPKHSGVSGYRYDSIACYSCHPQGRAN